MYIICRFKVFYTFYPKNIIISTLSFLKSIVISIRSHYVFIEISTSLLGNSIEISIRKKIQPTLSYIPLTGFSLPLWHSLPLHAKLLLFPASKTPVSPANPAFLPLSVPVAVACFSIHFSNCDFSSFSD